MNKKHWIRKHEAPNRRRGVTMPVGRRSAGQGMRVECAKVVSCWPSCGPASDE
jgi:hypothetical protein